MLIVCISKSVFTYQNLSISRFCIKQLLPIVVYVLYSRKSNSQNYVGTKYLKSNIEVKIKTCFPHKAEDKCNRKLFKFFPKTYYKIQYLDLYLVWIYLNLIRFRLYCRFVFTGRNHKRIKKQSDKINRHPKSQYNEIWNIYGEMEKNMGLELINSSKVLVEEKKRFVV